MKLEVNYNSKLYYYEHCGNYIQACIKALQDYIQDTNEVPPIVNFYVYNLDNYDGCEVDFGVVFGILNLNNEYEELKHETV
jgi:hypothetical protein